MRVHSVVPWIAIVGIVTGWSPRAAVGQELTLVSRTPRFFYASSTAATPVEIDVSHSVVLGRVVSLRMERATVGRLLAEIQRQTGLTFAYDRRFPASRAVTIEAKAITVAAALGAILVGTGVDVVLTRTGHAWLTETRPRAPRAKEGAIVGRVTDKRTDDPIIGATVTLDPGRQTSTTGSDGRFRFANLASNSYTVRARYIGYTSLVASVAVGADAEVVVDFPLEKSAQPLEQVVVTGTVVPTEVKALPTPVSVINEREIAEQRPATVQELFRQVVPTAVSWDYPNNPSQTPFSVRGASTLSPGLGQMKVVLDGVEMAWPTFAAIDPGSIERIEVIRGPQAAVIYGSDAIGGVIQIFTKRGDPSLRRPEVDAEAALGVSQTPYRGYRSVLQQDYTASVRGGAPYVSYSFGASYSHTGDYLPNGEVSRQSNPSVYGAMRFGRGIITVDVSGRHYMQDNPDVLNPALLQTGFAFFSKPFQRPIQNQHQTYVARIGLTPVSWWQHTLTVGVDRRTSDMAQLGPRFTTAVDTLLIVQNSARTKTSIGYTTSAQSSLGSGLSGSLTAGFDHYSLPIDQFFTVGALNTTGTIRTAPGQSISASRSITNNTGYFAQMQVGLRDALFLTGGLRAEENSNFGDSLGTPVSPRAGLSYVQRLGGAMFKLRGSYGRAIRAPDPGLKFALVTSTSEILANPQLGPERQKGWDAGVEAAFGSQASLSLTYYDQRADDLIQQVQLQSAPVRTLQWQNVGRVKNTGFEIEGAISLGPVRLKGQYGNTKSRIEQLPPNYAGDLQVGDQSLATPRHTAGASLTVSPLGRTTVAAGLSYIGSWNYYDFLALYRCFGGTGPCQPGPGLRNYVIAYPGFIKLNATLAQQLTPFLSGFVSVHNLTNNEAYEVFNGSPVIGRTTTAGFQFHY